MDNQHCRPKCQSSIASKKSLSSPPLSSATAMVVVATVVDWEVVAVEAVAGLADVRAGMQVVSSVATAAVARGEPAQKYEPGRPQ